MQAGSRMRTSLHRWVSGPGHQGWVSRETQPARLGPETQPRWLVPENQPAGWFLHENWPLLAGSPVMCRFPLQAAARVANSLA